MDKDDFVVFFNFDFGSYYRKNVPAAIRAFSKAFRGEPKVKLLFKTKGAKSNPKQVKEMMMEVEAAGIAPQFVHISRYLPRADIDGLTEACDVYLSLHKSEGFGIGMAEAMSQGKPVVATDWSANTEFCRPETAWCIPYRMIPIRPHEYPESMKEWAGADVDAAAAALREIRNNPSLAAERAAHGKRFMEEHYSIANFKADVEKMLAK
jgi:glycosyltransferase involved in cell wall biosynthesis